MDDVVAFILGGIVGILIALPYADNIKRIIKKMLSAVLREEKKVEVPVLKEEKKKVKREKVKKVESVEQPEEKEVEKKKEEEEEEVVFTEWK